MSDEFDPSKIDRLVAKMAELQLSLSELVRESVKNDVRNKVEVSEEVDTTKSAVQAVQDVLQSGVRDQEVEIQTPDAKQVTQEIRQQDLLLSTPSIPEMQGAAPEAPGREQEPLNLSALPAFDSPLPPQEPQVPPATQTPVLPINIEAAPDIAAPQVQVQAPQPFEPSSASDSPIPEPQFQPPLPLDLPGDKIEQAPDLKGVDPISVAPFVMDSSPVARLDDTTQQTHWEQDLFSDAVQNLGDYRDESRRWRRNIISILEYMCQDLRMDNTMLESILRHFELSRRSP